MSYIKLHNIFDVSSKFSSHQNKYKKSVAGAIDQQKQVINIKEYNMAGEQNEQEAENPALGQAAGLSKSLRIDIQYNHDLFARQVADVEGVDATLKLVLFMLNFYSDDDGIYSKTHAFLNKKTSIHRNTISIKLNEAEEKGWLKTIFNHPKSPRKNAPVYELIMQDERS